MDYIENKLKAIMYRHDCPSKMDLGEYDLGILISPRREEITLHAVTCPLCQADLVQIRQFMAISPIDEPPVKLKKEAKLPLIEKIKIVVVDLVSPPANLQISTSLQPAMRGEENDMLTRVFQIESYIIALSLMKDLSSWQKQQIIGDISPASGSEENFRNWTIYLWRAGKLLATSPVDRDSHFFFEDIQVENKPHELILSGPEVQIHLQNLQMS